MHKAVKGLICKMNYSVTSPVLIHSYYKASFNTARSCPKMLEISRSEEFNFGDSLMGWDTRWGDGIPDRGIASQIWGWHTRYVNGIPDRGPPSPPLAHTPPGWDVHFDPPAPCLPPLAPTSSPSSGPCSPWLGCLFRSPCPLPPPL